MMKDKKKIIIIVVKSHGARFEAYYKDEPSWKSYGDTEDEAVLNTKIRLEKTGDFEFKVENH